jgi:hypothetical protein
MSPAAAIVEHARMLLHERHPRLVHPRAARREAEMRQLSLRRERCRGRVTPPEFGHVFPM